MSALLSVSRMLGEKNKKKIAAAKKAKQEKQLKRRWSVQIGDTSYLINYNNEQERVSAQVLAQDLPDGQRVEYQRDQSKQFNLDAKKNGEGVNFQIGGHQAKISSNGGGYELCIGDTVVP